MSAISATNTSNNSAIASLIKDAASSGSALASQGSTSSSSAGGSSASSSDPVDTVDLSDRAKQILARAKSEQAAGDKLNALLQSIKNPDGKDIASKAKTSDQTSLFDQLSGKLQQQTSNTTWTAGSKYGDASISDAAFIEKNKDAFLVALSGAPPEKLAALQAAINSGTLKIQKGSDVPGYNNRTVITYSGSPGGLQGMSTPAYVPPTGAAKDAIDQGNAIAQWTEDRGDIYVTW